MAIQCTWGNKEENCAEIFETESTDDGFCCSFNSIILYRNRTYNQKKLDELINLGKQIYSTLILEYRLRYSNQAGAYSGLSIVLNAEREDYNVTSSSTVGFKVPYCVLIELIYPSDVSYNGFLCQQFSIQTPADFARTGRIGFLASPGRQIDAAVKGETQVSSKKVKAIDVAKRLCVLDGDMKLTYFENYTKPYCQLDCLTKSFMADCKCVPYFFPGQFLGAFYTSCGSNSVISY